MEIAIFLINGGHMKRLFTSESVTEGHPDKVADQISDAVLDAALGADPMSRVACETACSTGFALVMGEITTKAELDVEKIAREVILDIGYDDDAIGFNGNTCDIVVKLDQQSSDIALGVDNSLENKADATDAYDLIGAGDQGMVFGYATDETEALMPMPIYLAHQLTARLTEVRKSGLLPYLRPDGKAQVTIEYEDDEPVRVEAVVVSSQHDENVSIDQLRADIEKYVIREVIDAKYMKDTKIYINPTGRFVIGGPHGDSGLTGRKIIVDSYGGYCPHGGGAFSGKDPTKVDRSACYMARYVCKNIVASGIARKCQLDIAYAIGVAKPVSIEVNTFGTGKYSNEKIKEIVSKVFDLRPSAIIDTLDLRKPVFRATTNYGHFGRDGFSWEKCDKVDAIKAYVAKNFD